MQSEPGTISAASGLGTGLGLLAHLQPQELTTACERRCTLGSSPACPDHAQSLHLLRPFRCRRRRPGGSCLSKTRRSLLPGAPEPATGSPCVPEQARPAVALSLSCVKRLKGSHTWPWAG